MVWRFGARDEVYERRFVGVMFGCAGVWKSAFVHVVI